MGTNVEKFVAGELFGVFVEGKEKSSKNFFLRKILAEKGLSCKKNSKVLCFRAALTLSNSRSASCRCVKIILFVMCELDRWLLSVSKSPAPSRHVTVKAL